MTPEQMHFFALELQEMEKQALLLAAAKVTGKLIPGAARAGRQEGFSILRTLGQKYKTATPAQRVGIKSQMNNVQRTMRQLRNPVKGSGPNNLPPPPSAVSRKVTRVTNRVAKASGRAQGNVTAAASKVNTKLVTSGVGEVIQGANTALINTGGNVAGIADVATTAAGGALKGLSKMPKALNGTRQINRIAGEVIEGIGNVT